MILGFGPHALSPLLACARQSHVPSPLFYGREEAREDPAGAKRWATKHFKGGHTEEDKYGMGYRSRENGGVVLVFLGPV